MSSNDMSLKKTLHDLDDHDIHCKKVLVRVDFNVPLDERQNVADDTRIIMALPTINYLRDRKAKIILMSHLGRPKGHYNSKYSLQPVAEYMSKELRLPVSFAEDCIGEEAHKKADALLPGEILILENLRFHPEEESNDPAFAKELASMADIYVNDAFGTAHRSHASTEGVAHLLPACAGLLMEKEIISLNSVLMKPSRPFVAIIGGAKISDKIAVIENLLIKVDKLLIGGGMANTFLAAQGYNMQKSLVESAKIEWAKELLTFPAAKEKLILPVDLLAAAEFSNDAEFKQVTVDKIPENWQALDIGMKTISLFQDEIMKAATIVWNGPLGVFEMDNFDQGTIRVAKAVAASEGFSIIGGGDSVAAINKAGLEDKIDHISTGGGASLKVLEGKILPGLDALDDISQ